MLPPPNPPSKNEPENCRVWAFKIWEELDTLLVKKGNGSLGEENMEVRDGSNNEEEEEDAIVVVVVERWTG